MTEFLHRHDRLSVKTNKRRGNRKTGYDDRTGKLMNVGRTIVITPYKPMRQSLHLTVTSNDVVTTTDLLDSVNAVVLTRRSSEEVYEEEDRAEGRTTPVDTSTIVYLVQCRRPKKDKELSGSQTRQQQSEGIVHDKTPKVHCQTHTNVS